MTNLSETLSLNVERCAGINPLNCESGLSRRHMERLAVLTDPLVCKARAAAHSAFRAISRKTPCDSDITPLPYVTHLEEVARILADYGYGPEVVAAGYLHDHIEDVKWSFEQIEQGFGERVATLVSFVTENKNEPDWNLRKELYAEHLESGPDEAVAISAADKTSNLRSLNEYMAIGFKVGQVLKHSYEETLKRHLRLRGIFEGRVPPALLEVFDRQLTIFMEMGEMLEAGD